MYSSRHTLQREIVLQEILKIQGHATADMIYDKIHESYPSISRATVYRNLRALEKQGKIMRISIPDGADYFESSKQKHYHIKCNCCEKIYDASLCYNPKLLELAQEADKNFDLISCNLLFEGLCPSCKIKFKNREEY